MNRTAVRPMVRRGEPGRGQWCIRRTDDQHFCGSASCAQTHAAQNLYSADLRQVQVKLFIRVMRQGKEKCRAATRIGLVPDTASLTLDYLLADRQLEKKYAGRLDGKAAGYLTYCVEGARRMQMLISDLLAYCQAAKTSDSPLESVSISEVIDTVKKKSKRFCLLLIRPRP